MTPPDAETPSFLLPFVLPLDAVQPVRDGPIDWYLPSGSDLHPAPTHPAVVFIHGGPLPAHVEPKPRGWPSFQAYGAWAAGAGLVGVVFDHDFSSLDNLDVARGDIARAVEATRAHPRVDPSRVVLWGFSGAGMLLGDWIAAPPDWLRGVAASYPCCRPLSDIAGPPTMMADAVASAGELPLLLTRVGLERAPVAETVAELVEAAGSAGTRLDVIDVPAGHHGFDQLDDTDQSRDAIRRSMAWVQTRLR